MRGVRLGSSTFRTDAVELANRDGTQRLETTRSPLCHCIVTKCETRVNACFVFCRLFPFRIEMVSVFADIKQRPEAINRHYLPKPCSVTRRFVHSQHESDLRVIKRGLFRN